MHDSVSAKNLVKEAIQKEVFTQASDKIVIIPKSKWLFDFRKVLLRGDILDASAEIFYEKFKHYDRLQIGGMESAAIPLVAACVMKFQEHGKNINGFYIRKSRKKTGLLNIIEGVVSPHDPVILVDDLMNRGGSFRKQVEILKEAGCKVDTVFALLRFRELSHYSYFHENGILIDSLFTLEDFKESLGTDFLKEIAEAPIPDVFSVEWYFQSSHPKLDKVIPKSGIALDEKQLYFGSDQGILWTIDQESGKTLRQYKVAGRMKDTEIFSTPIVWEQKIYFASYDGNVYCLDASTGERMFISFSADWIQGSLSLLASRKMLIVPSVFGLWGKRGGIVALDAKTGKTMWQIECHGSVTATPLYSEKNESLYFADDEGNVYAADVRSGNMLWTMKTRGAVRGAIGIDQEEKKCIVQNMRGEVIALHAKNGQIFWKRDFEEAGFYSDATLSDGYVYSACLDKNLYCLDLETGEQKWVFSTRGRIFASPMVIDDKLYIGSNDGILYVIDPERGKQTGFHQFTERITNRISYNPQTKRFFVSTFANELYCLSLKAVSDPLS